MIESCKEDVRDRDWRETTSQVGELSGTAEYLVHTTERVGGMGCLDYGKREW